MSTNSVHIRFERDEAVEGKKGILITEERLLRVIKKLKRYKEVRKKELKLKSKLKKDIKDISTNITKLKNNLPKPKVPESIKNHEEKTSEEKNTKRRYDEDIENQIKEIHNKIKDIEKLY